MRDLTQNIGTGLHRFMGVNLECAPDVLVPRAALAIASEVPSSTVWAAVLTDSAVALARRDTGRLVLNDRVMIRQDDLLSASASNADGDQKS